jgi:hypothetical protein
MRRCCNCVVAVVLFAKRASRNRNRPRYRGIEVPFMLVTIPQPGLRRPPSSAALCLVNCTISAVDQIFARHSAIVLSSTLTFFALAWPLLRVAFKQDSPMIQGMMTSAIGVRCQLRRLNRLGAAGGGAAEAPYVTSHATVAESLLHVGVDRVTVRKLRESLSSEIPEMATRAVTRASATRQVENKTIAMWLAKLCPTPETPES